MCELRKENRHFYAEYVMKYAVCGILFDEDSHTTQDSAQNLDNYLSLTRLDATVEGNPRLYGHNLLQ